MHTDDRWWDLIERCRKGGIDGLADRLVERLGELPVDEIVAFDTFLMERFRDAYRADLWEVAYVMSGGCSDDGFDYFLGWLVGKGRKHYEGALADPEKAASRVRPDEEPFELEDLWGVASRAYAKSTGKKRDAYYAIAPNVPRTLIGEIFDEDRAFERYPKIAARFG